MSEIKLLEGEKIEKLHTGQTFIQNDRMFKFGIDAVLLADFAAKEIRNGNSVLDMCTGNGIVPVLLANSSRASSITGIELQEEVAHLAQKNVEINSLEGKISIKCIDLKNSSSTFAAQTFDAVTVNPPYMKITKGKISPNKALSIARTEIECTLEDVIKCASYNLKSNGNFFMIHRPERMQEIFVLLERYNLGTKSVQLVLPYQDESATMLMIHAKKDFKPEMKVLKNLVVSNKDGTYTDDLMKIYGGTSRGANLCYD